MKSSETNVSQIPTPEFPFVPIFLMVRHYSNFPVFIKTDCARTWRIRNNLNANYNKTNRVRKVWTSPCCCCILERPSTSPFDIQPQQTTARAIYDGSYVRCFGVDLPKPILTKNPRVSVLRRTISSSSSSPFPKGPKNFSKMPLLE